MHTDHLRGKMIYAKKTRKTWMHVGVVVGIPSTMWMTEETYCCPQCWKLRQNIIGATYG